MCPLTAGRRSATPSPQTYLTTQAFRAAHDQVGFGGQGVINAGHQGTNDANNDSAHFQPAYLSYLKRIRASYPSAWIFAMRPFGGAHQADIDSTVAALQDPEMVYVDTAGWLQQPQDFTDGVHPTVAAHARAAARLTEVIKTKTGWQSA